MMNSLTKYLAVVLLICQLNHVRAQQIVTRQQWSARKATINPSSLPVPVKKVIINHSATLECSDTESCVDTVRRIQNSHIDSRKFGDIGYNFLVGGDGLIYEGRGWKLQGTHTNGHDQNSICITFIGNFETKRPTDQQLRNAQLLLEQGIIQKYLTTDYKLYSTNQLTPTASPGFALYKAIKSWPHWSPILQYNNNFNN